MHTSQVGYIQTHERTYTYISISTSSHRLLFFVVVIIIYRTKKKQHKRPKYCRDNTTTHMSNRYNIPSGRMVAAVT